MGLASLNQLKLSRWMSVHSQFLRGTIALPTQSRLTTQSQSMTKLRTKKQTRNIRVA